MTAAEKQTRGGSSTGKWRCSFSQVGQARGPAPSVIFNLTSPPQPSLTPTPSQVSKSMEPTNKMTVNQPQAAIQMSKSILPCRERDGECVVNRRHEPGACAQPPRTSRQAHSWRWCWQGMPSPCPRREYIIDGVVTFFRIASWPPSSASFALVRTFRGVVSNTGD